MKNFTFLIIVLLFSACSGGGNYNNNHSNGNKEEEIVEDTYSAQQQGYNQGYQDGYSDGYGWKQHGVSYSDRNNYQTDDGVNAYKNGYSGGYDTGYEEGESKIIAEREEGKRNDYHNWEDEDIEGFYIELENCNSDDQADYYAREYYEGEYIEDGGRYFAKISVTSGTYEVEVGERVSEHLVQNGDTEVFIHFRWMAGLWRWDKGVMEVFGNRGTFYKHPDN